MSDDLYYINKKLDELVDGQNRLEAKVDKLLQTSAVHAQEIKGHEESLVSHAQILYLGNGTQLPLTVKINELETKVTSKQEEPGSLKDRAAEWGKVSVVASLVVNAIAQWFLGSNG